jgi:hypothetical protein
MLDYIDRKSLRDDAASHAYSLASVTRAGRRL